MHSTRGQHVVISSIQIPPAAEKVWKLNLNYFGILDRELPKNSFEQIEFSSQLCTFWRLSLFIGLLTPREDDTVRSSVLFSILPKVSRWLDILYTELFREKATCDLYSMEIERWMIIPTLSTHRLCSAEAMGLIYRNTDSPDYKKKSQKRFPW